MQLMENPEISGAEYQKGELAGYEIREYLLNQMEEDLCLLRRQEYFRCS